MSHTENKKPTSKGKRLGIKDRVVIEQLLKANTPVTIIAKAVGFSRVTIYNEIKRGTNGKQGYSASYAQNSIGG